MTRFFLRRQELRKCTVFSPKVHRCSHVVRASTLSPSLRVAQPPLSLSDVRLWRVRTQPALADDVIRRVTTNSCSAALLCSLTHVSKSVRMSHGGCGGCSMPISAYHATEPVIVCRAVILNDLSGLPSYVRYHQDLSFPSPMMTRIQPF